MGNGIAHACARAGFKVLLCDLQQNLLDHGLVTIDKNLAREASKEKLTKQQAEDVRARITSTTDRESLHRCTLAIEAATEKIRD
jgi:3-hydroxyacyl-CoA dehydrogenase